MPNRIDAPSGAHVASCAECARPFYSSERDRETCATCAAARAAVLATVPHVCPVCAHEWQGPGAGRAGDACPCLGCAGRV